LKSQPTLVTASQQQIQDADVSSSLDQLGALRTSALTGAATVGISLADSQRHHGRLVPRQLRAQPLGRLKARSPPASVSVSTVQRRRRVSQWRGFGSSYGHSVVAPADGVVTFVDFMGGYGKAIMVDHGHGISTRYGHLSGFAVTPGQQVHRGDTIGYVGTSGRSTGPHLHYEVRINDTQSIL